MPNAWNTAAIFLVNSLFDLYLYVLMIRLILVFVRADYFNPLSQFVLKLTNPVVMPFRRILPLVARIEFATIVIMLLLELIRFYLLGVIAYGVPNVGGVFILALVDMLKILINTFFYAILLQAILSWIPTGPNPATFLMMQITSPILRPMQRLIPPIGGFDISPIPAMIILQLINILLVSPLYLYAVRLAYG